MDIISQKQFTVSPPSSRNSDQLLFQRDDDDFHHSIVEKLRGRYDEKQFVNFAKCGATEIYAKCKGCGQTSEKPYRCNLKWCPKCQWRLSEARRQFLSVYASTMNQPKHMVLTRKNTAMLTRKNFRQNQAAMAALRGEKCMKKMRGGCASVEVTWNEKNSLINGVEVAGGFHLHSHWLVDADWIKIQDVKKSWAKLIGQEFAIAEIYDARDEEYLKELCKYVVEASELAKWPPEIIHQFVRAVRGVRCFFTFGNLRQRASAIREELEFSKTLRPRCGCGCDDVKYRRHESERSKEEKWSLLKRKRYGFFENYKIPVDAHIPSMRHLLPK
jgi:replication protein